MTFIPGHNDILAAMLVIACLAFVAGRLVVVGQARRDGRVLASLSVYYGWYCAMGAFLPAAALAGLGWLFPIPVAVIGYGVPLLAGIGAAVTLIQIRPEMKAQIQVERLIQWLLFASGFVAILTTIGIVLSLIFETGRFFTSPGVSVVEFFTGLEWSAQTSASFGAVPLFFGTFFVAMIALVFAAPVGFFSAIYLAEYASPNQRRVIKPALEVLAGIPTVVYGFFAILIVAPLVRELGDSLSGMIEALTGQPDVISAQPKSALAAGLVMGIMIIPFISSLSDDVIRTVPAKLKNGALGIGATRSEVMRHIILPAAFPGLMAALLLAVSRAIGETMIVVMAAGERANLTLNPFEDVTTVTVQIVALLTGDPEFDSPRTLSAFALGAVLFSVTLVFNMFAQWVVDRQRRLYAGL